MNRVLAPNHCWRTGRVFLKFAALLAMFAAASSAVADPSPVSEESRAKAIEAIRLVLSEQSRWTKVHAAEYLLALDYPEGVKDAFLEELKVHGDEPQYRIGIWRVLAECEYQDAQRAAWIGKIHDVAFDDAAPDRVHAIEALAKLGYALQSDELEPIEQAARRDDATIGPYAAWLLAGARPMEGESKLTDLLDSADAENRSVAAYALGQLRLIDPVTQRRLSAAAEREPAESKVSASLVAAAAVSAPPEERSAWKSKLLGLAANGDNDERLAASGALAQIGDASDLPLLSQWLHDSNADLRASAADAILRIDRRQPHPLQPLDWIVIAGYGLAVLSVGVYFSRRSKTREDYLLGGRRMRPLTVGISLFASLISTISYLSWPGEIIKNGPMMLSVVLAYPLVAIVIGWGIIPFFMKLKITTAYEILEIRLGPAVRMLGSLLFLSLRLLWMSVIVYATASKVLVPLLGLDPRFTPMVCLTLAMIAIIYTALGGLRAVVVTDVIQSAILCSAAMVTIVTITICLGGVHAWWPSHWPTHWPEPCYGYDPSARATMFGAVLVQFTWYLCTSASDQIAIQRYLATKDAKSARTVLFVSMLSDGIVTLILGAVGLGLLAYFRTFPQLLPDAQTVVAGGDRLFARFMVVGLPVGLCGLVVAGLLACAMSALSAGINSTCSVITVDILDRLRSKKAVAASGQMRQLRYVSLLVGLTVVCLSLCVDLLQGNLLDICYKVVNLFTAPLAGLFFLAMFVPWARGFGALVGAACGLTVVIAISYWKEITGVPGISFLWAMPLSLIVEVGVGALASLIPIGRSIPLEVEEADP